MDSPSLQKTIAPEDSQAAQTIAPGDPEEPASQAADGAVAVKVTATSDTPQITGYEFVKRLGEGGMGVVWQAVQMSTRREVAVKLLGGAFGSERILARFTREVELSARLNHPNICDVYDSGVERNIHYYVMQLVQGEPLDVYVRKHALTRPQILKLMRTVIGAVQYAHQKGVIHRDLKPSNILVTADGMPMVLDFGLAKALQDTDSRHDVSLDGEVSGTPAYMSPEQAAGKRDAIDTRTDVYSLGVILFELLTGKKPHDDQGTIFQVIKRIVQDEPRRAREIDPSIDRELEAIVMKALAKNPEERYLSAGTLGQDMDHYFKGEPIDARQHTPIYFLAHSLVRYRKWLIAAAIVIAVGIGIFARVWAKIVYERNQAMDAKIVSDHATADAKKHFDQARATVADMLDVCQGDLYDAPGFVPLRRKLMKLSIDRYQQFVQHDKADPGPTAELARLYATYATELRSAPDGSAVALDSLAKAKAIQETLVSDNPDNAVYRENLGWTLSIIGWVSRDPAQVRDARQQSLDIREKLAEADPADPFTWADLAWSEWWMAEGETGPEAAAHRQRGTELREELVKEFPKSGEFRRDLANSYEDDAVAIEATDPAGALKLQEKALALREAVVDDLKAGAPGVLDPQRTPDSEGRMLRLSSLWMQRDLGINYSAIAALQARLGKFDEASVSACKGRDVLWPLTEQNPTVVDFVSALDDSCALVQKTAAAGGNQAEATQELNKELTDLKNLSAARPDATDLAAKIKEVEARVAAQKSTDGNSPAPKPAMIP